MAYGITKEIMKKLKVNTEFDSLTVGTVIDTNDPQQMGRIRVFCSAWDSDNVQLKDIPWATFVAPFGGTIKTPTSRGPEDEKSNGSISYGAWHIPKVGANVIVMCVDKNPHYRVWLGCVYDQFKPHTMPHGRFLNDDKDGPISSLESPIEPLNKNYNKAFADSKQYEWRTRIADYPVAAIDTVITNQKRTESQLPDTKEGYSLSRIEPDAIIESRKNFDSQVYCWVTPSFHAFSMDDRAENSRMRLRTASGHQILMDDTNERIYIMTAEGENWIEMDQKGNIDIFSNRRISIRSKNDINLTSDETVRLHGKKGLHLSTEQGDIRMDAKQSSFHFNADNNFVIKTADHYSLEAKNVDVSAGGYISLGASSKLNLKSSFTHVTGTDSVFINGNSSVLVSGGAIHLNGPSAPSAASPTIEKLENTYWTNRVPDHEPWARVIIKNPANNINHTPEMTSSDVNVNKTEEGKSLGRNKNWRR